MYWEAARRFLMRSDPILADIIRGRPSIFLLPRHDAFYTLVRAIIGQQISVRAAASVWAKFEKTAGEVNPPAVLRSSAALLRACGLSERKVGYVRDLALHFDQGFIEADRLPSLGDEDVIALLTAVRGVGRWTAEMFLIFNLVRPDVLPLGDVGLQRAVAKHYFGGRPVSPRTIMRIAKKWKPWRSVATWYLWRSLEPTPVNY